MNDKTPFGTGRKAEIVKLQIHSWYGQLLNKVEGKVTEPIIGVMMIDSIKDLFGLSDQDVEVLREMEFRRNLKEQKELIKLDKAIFK